MGVGVSISSLVFQPPQVTYLHAKKHIIWLQTKKRASIPAFFIDKKAKITVLFSHGNAEDLGMIFDWFSVFSQELQVNVFAYDYEGYGKASGLPSEEGCYDDIDAAFSYVTEVLHVAPSSLLLYGRSLGSAVSVYLANKLHHQGVVLGGLVLQSPLLSVYRVAFNFRFTLPGDMFPSIDRINDVSCPVFIIHGTTDEIVPFWNGEDLLLHSPPHLRAKPYWVMYAGHNNVESKNTTMFFRRWREFLLEWCG